MSKDEPVSEWANTRDLPFNSRVPMLDKAFNRAACRPDFFVLWKGVLFRRWV